MLNRNRPLRRLAPLLVCAALLLTCGCGKQPADPDVGLPDDALTGELPGKTPFKANAADDVFSLAYNPEMSLNPITTRSEDNILVSELVYETLVRVDNDYQWHPNLISDCTTSDGVWWVFTVDTTRAFSDGTPVTPKDCAYSIQRAQRAARFSGRLRNVYGASAISETQFAVSLAKADMLFPARLVIPVIPYGSGNLDYPLGTGPYAFSTDCTSLVVNAVWPQADSLPLDTICLRATVLAEDRIAEFEDGLIDLVVHDPGGTSNLGYGGVTDARLFHTTNLHYLGINQKNVMFRYPACRFALHFAVNRAYITNTLLGGTAVQTVLPLPPSCPYYLSSYTDRLRFDLDKCKTILNNAGLDDYDEDGQLEFMEAGIPAELNLRMIVCSDSTTKLEAARRIASDLNGIGLPVTLSELDWNSYTKALADGEFDLYYAEVMLTPDWDLTELFAEGGTLNFMGETDPNYLSYIDQFLAAPDEELRQQCGKILLEYVAETAPIIPICFERHQVLTRRDVVSGMSPTQYNVFDNIAEWKVDLGRTQEK